MPVDDQEVLRAYLERVMELSDERAAGLTEEELRTIAREVGISDADLAAAEQSAEDHRLRGAGFIDHGLYDDAIGELSEAVALAPTRLEIQHDLARAYAGRFRRRRQEKDREQAETLARRHLESDPRHQGSFALLNELGGIAPPAVGGDTRPRKQTSLRVWALTGSLVLGGGVLLFNRLEPVTPPSAEPAGNPGVVESIEGAPDSQLSDTSSSDGAAAAEVDIPIRLDTELDLDFDLRRSRLNNYVTGKSFYTLNAVLGNKGGSELEKVSARLDLLRSSEQVSTSKVIELLPSSVPPLRPGDFHAVHHLWEVEDSDIRNARLVVERVDQVPAAGDYGAPEPVQVHWSANPPSGLEIAAYKRNQRFTESAFGDKREGHFEAVLEIENSGAQTIRGLRLSGVVAGGGGSWTTEIERHVVVRRGPDLRAGGQRIVRFLARIPEKPESFEVSVVDIR